MRIAELMPQTTHLWEEDRYLHWNELRRRPAPKGMSHEEWWLLLKMGRKAKFIPLTDKNGHAFRFSMPDSMIAKLHETDLGLGTFWSLPDAVTNPASRNEYVISTLIQESITSSQLEGAVTTREVAKEMLRTGRKPRDRSERMILNNYETMQRIGEIREQPLSRDLVFELHRRVTDETLDDPTAAGRFRQDNEYRVVGDDLGEVYHNPPP